MPRMRSASRAGWKSSIASIFSPTPSSLIGLPVTARMESAAPPRPSPSMRVSTMPVRPTRSLKLLARLTASWPVSASATSSTSCGCDRLADLGHLRHQRLVDVGAPRGVEQHDVIALEPRRGFRALGDVDRVLAGNDRQRVDADLPAENGELLLRGRPLHVERGHQHLAPVALEQALGDLRGGGRLARALQADQHDRDRRGRVEIDRLRFAAQRLHQRVVDDLHHHLAGLDRLDDGGADRLGAGAVDKGAHDLERHVRLEQRAAHFAHRGVDVLLGEGAAAGQFVQYAGELLGKALEHACSFSGEWRVASGE